MARLIDAVVERSLTIVVGPPGCGKSSLVHAGVVPALRERGWLVLPTVRPGLSPRESLTARLQPTGRSTAAADPATRSSTAASPASQTPRLLIVDALEELVTHRVSPRDRAAFLEDLAARVDTDPALHIIAIADADAEARLRDSALARSWTGSRFAMPEPTR